MRLLLDTCTFLWLTEGDDRLSNKARSMIVESDNEVFLSPASVWEIVIKHGLGRLILKQPPDQYIVKQRHLHRIDSLVIDEQTVLHIGKLPSIHRDPFDRLLVAQAIIHECLILTPDPLIRRYPARVIW
ncbi:hypothetical protein ES705_06601 [subsurface metagenome]